MASRWILKLLRAERVLEAVLTTSDLRLEQVHPATILLIGRHARDVLGRFASQCQSRKLIIDLIWPELIPPFLFEIDPWGPRPDPKEKGKGKLDILPPDLDGLPWLDADVLLDTVFGAALLSVNQEWKADSDTPPSDDEARKLAAKGAQQGLEIAGKSFARSCEALKRALEQ